MNKRQKKKLYKKLGYKKYIKNSLSFEDLFKRYLKVTYTSDMMNKALSKPNPVLKLMEK